MALGLTLLKKFASRNWIHFLSQLTTWHLVITLIIKIGATSANSFPMFVAFLEPQIQSAMNHSLPTHIHQCKSLEIMNL